MFFKNPFQATLLSLIIACTLVLPLSLEAQQNRQTHIVRQGETLFSISRQYNISIGELRSWNELSGNQINIGQRLIVSPPGGAPNPVSPTPAPKPTTEPTQSEGTAMIRHQVRAGETLFSLSRRYGVTVNNIRSWNNLNTNLLEVGQLLTIYTDGRDIQEQTLTPPVPTTPREQPISQNPPPQPATETATTPVPSPITIQNTGSAYHIVKSGDTLSQIADSNGLTVDELRTLNNLQSNRLTVGQVLMVRRPQGLPSVATGTNEYSPQGRFITHEIRRNERLNDILSRYNMTESELIALNPDIDVRNLQVGLSLTVLIPPTTVFKNPYRAIVDTNGSNTSDNKSGVPARATRYSDLDRARSTTNGDLYNPLSFTAAHNSLPLGSIVYVENEASGYGIFVLINDRITDSGIKLSHVAFESLGFTPSANNLAIIKP
jgi:LysM repeat protein